MIFVGAPKVVNTFIIERTRALRLCSPSAQHIVIFGSLVLFLDHSLEVRTSKIAMAPRPIVRIGVGTPWRVVIDGCAPNVMSAFVIEFFHAPRGRLPLALRLICEVAPDRVARPTAITPVVSANVVRIFIIMLAPRCIMVHCWTSSVHDTFPRKLWSASWWLFPSAVVSLGLEDSFCAARTGEPAFITLPCTYVTNEILSRLSVGEAVAILKWDITF
jgi:hypothetical protein